MMVCLLTFNIIIVSNKAEVVTAFHKRIGLRERSGLSGLLPDITTVYSANFDCQCRHTCRVPTDVEYSLYSCMPKLELKEW